MPTAGLTADPAPAMDRQRVAHVTKRFLALRDVRLFRLREPLAARQREVLDLLPLLFHLNHSHLPAFVGDDVPAGLPHYEPTRDTAQTARKFLRTQSLGGHANSRFELHGLYLMGSSGSLGQARDSDLDVWLIHDDQMSAPALGRLKQKAAAIESWARSQDTELHVFTIDASGFRAGRKDALSDDNSGGLQHALLLEEFYRTALLLAGRPPLWWLTPLNDDRDHQAQLATLRTTLGVNTDEWIDFGPIGHIDADEFFSSAHWQLHKGIGAPYKSVLKLMLTEAYAAQYPKVHWLCDQLKRAVHGDQALDPDQLDPYRMLLMRLTNHLTERGEPDRLELARRSLYVKTGARLSAPAATDDWRAAQLRELSTKWGWDQRHWQLLDARPDWKLERVVEERDALVAELTRSYHLLTDFARQNGSDMSRNGRELSLLGRRLYAALERRPGKVELINPGISRDLSESKLWISRHASGGQGGHWRLFREPPGVLGTEAVPLKATGNLVEMLTWLKVNGLATAGTQLQLLPRPVDSGTPEHQRILHTLDKHLTVPDGHGPVISAFAQNPQAEQSLIFVNVAPPPSLGLEAPEALDAAYQTPVETVEHLVVSSWGELLVHQHDDGVAGLLDALCRHLNLTRGAARPVTLRAQCFSSGEVDAMAHRVGELAERIADSFAELGEDLRYLFVLKNTFYLIERNERGVRWLEVGDFEDLLHLLQEPLTAFRPTRVDPYRLSNSPLVQLYEHNRAGRVQVFFRTKHDGVEMFCLDDCGALFHQLYEDISEPVFLSQQKRLFDSLSNRRLLSSADLAGDMLADGAHFYRLAMSPEGWVVRPLESPQALPGQPLELLLVTDRDGLENNRFSLMVQHREFDGLRLGSRLYKEVAAHILTRRKPGQNYPIRITGVMPAGLEDGAGWSVNEMLRAKRRIERRLTQAMRDLSRTGPRSRATNR